MSLSHLHTVFLPLYTGVHWAANLTHSTLVMTLPVITRIDASMTRPLPAPHDART